MAGKSLLNKQSSAKPRKQDKYSELNGTKQEYRFKPTDKAIYVGLLDEYSGLECEIVKRSRRKITEYYTIKFSNEEIISDISGNFLMNHEEYELFLENKNKENNEDNLDDISEYELELMKLGIESHKNYVQCLVPTLFVNYACDRCNEKVRCVYKRKYQYDKLKLF
ncbi:MAG: hypothetical protein A2Y34_04455 [Spirochaetes bacterium GWC1_27_15]|nr:MAG: hypothetical protein A2Y34_04455 [Spirochaetes bacterium GWC1_27_15]